MVRKTSGINSENTKGNAKEVRDDDQITGDVPDPNTDTLDDLMEDAFVIPKIDDVGDNNDNVTFNLNLSDSTERSNALDWDSESMNSSRFWIAYILGTYQWDEVDSNQGDNDPDAETNVLGSTFSTNGGSIIYIEQHRENEIANPTSEEQDTVCHEVSHLFGSTDDPGQPISGGVYTPETLNYIRSSTKPAGN